MGGKPRPGYQPDYQRANYDRVVILFPKGKRQILKDYAAKQGESVTRIVIDALEEKTGLNLTD